MNGASNFQNAGLDALFDLSFSRFITLSVVKVLYILMLVLAVLSWLILVVVAFSQGFVAGVIGLIVGTLAMVIQIIVWRVLLELVVVIFRIGENTSALAGGGHLTAGGFPVSPTQVPPVH